MTGIVNFIFHIIKIYFLTINQHFSRWCVSKVLQYSTPRTESYPSARVIGKAPITQNFTHVHVRSHAEVKKHGLQLHIRITTRNPDLSELITNNKGTDQPAHPPILMISTFIHDSLDWPPSNMLHTKKLQLITSFYSNSVYLSDRAIS